MLPYCLAALFNVSLLSNQASLRRKYIRADAVATISLCDRYLLRVNFCRHLFGSVVQNPTILIAVSEDSGSHQRQFGCWALRSLYARVWTSLSKGSEISFSSSSISARMAALRI